MIEINDTLFNPAFFSQEQARITRQAGLGQRAGERLAVCFAEPQDWLAFFFAARAADVSILPLHPATPYTAARRQALNARCNRLFYNTLEAEHIEDEIVDTGGHLLQMSSGTTGEPKCIARSWDDVAGEVQTYVATFREPDAMTPLIACPITHSYGLICGLLVALERGQTPVVLDTGNPKFLLRKLREKPRPYLISSPAVLHTLTRLLPAGETIHASMTSGTLLPEPWFRLIRAKSEHMFQQYGCSEAGCIAINPDVQAANEMGFVLPRWSLASPGDEAESRAIVVQRDGVSIDTRDLGLVRADGMLVFVSRLDDLINVSGLNVYPKEVEDVIIDLPGVEDAVVFRRQDAFAGQRVAVLFSGQDVDAAAVRQWCVERLAPHQRPMEILRVEKIPRQANGKISRRDVALRYEAGEFASAEAA